MLHFLLRVGTEGVVAEEVPGGAQLLSPRTRVVQAVDVGDVSHIRDVTWEGELCWRVKAEHKVSVRVHPLNLN